MDKNRLSIIIPVYNAEEYLDRCLVSVIEQSFSSYEVILVDDGSPDNSGAICDAWAEKDCRIRVIHKENAGVCVARNTGLDWVYENSDSEWIFFHDNDDWMHPETLQRLYDAALAQHTKISIITS